MITSPPIANVPAMPLFKGVQPSVLYQIVYHTDSDMTFDQGACQTEKLNFKTFQVPYKGQVGV